jgi:hypothetical protein
LPESLDLARREKTFSLHRSKYLVALDLTAARLGWRRVPHVAAFQTFPRPATKACGLSDVVRSPFPSMDLED